MAARNPGVWGIDLGQSALKAVRLEMRDGEVVATAFEYIEHPKILSQPDADPDELTREALKQFLSRNQIQGDMIAISVPGQSGLARFVKLPPVDEKKIVDIVKFEAKQQIPFPLEEVVWDYQRLNKGDIVDGLALETEIGLFAIKRDMVNRAIAQFKDVGVEVHLVQMASLALCNMLAYDLLGKTGCEPTDDADNQECVVALEIGTDSSNLVITNGGRIIWQRPIPIGGNHFTRALTKEMKLTFAKAEHLKKNAAKSGSAELKKILTALKQVLNDFVGEVQRSLGYFTNTHRNAKIQYMVGLGNAFRLPGLQKFLQEKLQLEVRKYQKLNRATGESVTTAPTFMENIMSLGVAYGLALQGLKQSHLQTNLLPHEVRLERVIRGKKPWAVAAAASLLFGLCVLAFAQGMERNAIINDQNKKAQKDLERVAGETKKRNDEGANAEKEFGERLAQLDQVGSGVPDRPNWQLLHQYVNMALPQANGGRLALATKARRQPKQIYWDSNKASQYANLLFEYKKIGRLKDLPEADVRNIADFFIDTKDIKEEKSLKRFNVAKHKDMDQDETEKMDQFIKQNLIQINIVGINPMYTDDLGPFFRKLHKDGENLDGMQDLEKEMIRNFVKSTDPEEMKKSPLFEKGKDGWIIEIRGSTYHRAGENFVKDSIVENLGFPRFGKDNPGGAKSEKEIIDRVKERIGFLHLYKKPVIAAGQPGITEHSYLRDLVIGIQPEKADGGKEGGGDKMQFNQVGGGGDGGGGGGGGAEPKKNNRLDHQPIGEAARKAIGGGGGGGGGGPVGKPGGGPGMKPPGGDAGKFRPNDPGKGPGPADGKAKDGVERGMSRTEFVIVFVWREPIASATPVNTDEKK